MAKLGRKRVLTAEKRAKILKAIAIGASRNTAAASVGISTSTIANEAARSPDFLDALKKAEADCEIYHLRRIHKGDNRWQSSAWFMERKWRRWVQKVADPTPEAPPETSDLLETNPEVATAQVPPGAVPPLAPPSPVQDGSGGAAQRQDRDQQAQAGDVPLGGADQ